MEPLLPRLGPEYWAAIFVWIAGVSAGDNGFCFFRQPGHGVSQAVPNKGVLLQDLFKHRRLRDGSHGNPSRVLIRGHAGMGKTTLCKKITHAFVRDELWQSEFDSVLFIDLRVAKHFSSAYEFLELEFTVLFTTEENQFIEIMKAISDPGDTRTLVVFDGLEKLSEDQCESWDEYLYRKNLIITCRPHVLFKWKRLPFDLDVQVIGFHDDEVSSYLNKMAPDNQKPQLMDFIAQHPVIKDMLRIPIISDAVCSVWDDSVMRRKRLTMATFYQEIEIKLWQKDLIRLHGMTISHASSYIFPRKLYEIFSRELGFLRSIAFFGVSYNITEFPEGIRRKFQSFEPQVMEHVFDIISF